LTQLFNLVHPVHSENHKGCYDLGVELDYCQSSWSTSTDCVFMAQHCHTIWDLNKTAAFLWRISTAGVNECSLSVCLSVSCLSV